MGRINIRDETGQAGAWGVIGLLVVAVVAVIVVAIGGLSSLKSVDSAHVCVVKQGGPFDGRNLTTVRPPGSGVGSIGIWNSQICIPTTERDSNDILEGDLDFPTKDSVNVIAHDQVLFHFTTDPDKVRTFVKKYGLRPWRGEDITSNKGFINFLKERFSPAVMDAHRETLGSFECTQLNNLCQYVQQAEEAVKNGAKVVDNSQNLAKAQDQIAKALVIRLNAAFGDDYFENIRVQNLRITFENGVRDQIRSAQQLRTANANAALEAKRKVTAAQGTASAAKAEAEGRKNAKLEEAKGLKAYAKALRDPRVAEVEKVKALCGVREDGSPTGCQNLQVLGSSGVINALK
jgi:regulator of protease activity HflC (stomatin/prohibitin superfamily)